jgi:hypothetical protein
MSDATIVRESSSPCMAKLDRVSWASLDWFEIDGYRFGVRTTSDAFAEWVRYVLGDYGADGPSKPDQDALFSLVVDDPSAQGPRAGKRLLILYEGTADIVRTMDIRAVARSFLHEIEGITFPTRDDALYLEGSVIQGAVGTVLIPWTMVPAVNTASRQIRRAVDMVLPSTVSVAIDPATTHLVPVRTTLKIPADALDVLGTYVVVGAEDDVRTSVISDVAIDRVMVLGGDQWAPVLRPVQRRAEALFKLANVVRNAGALEGRALVTLGNLLTSTEVLETRWTSRQDLVEVVGAAMSGGYYPAAHGEGSP